MSKFDEVLEDVFGIAITSEPHGTGAVLTRPSKLSFEMVDKAVRSMPMDALYRDIGAIAGQVVADQLETQRLRPADYADAPKLPDIVSRRIVGYLLRSEEFSKALRRSLRSRG
jgi:formate-dependent phosphoribosylglycinamide formyltransferase (GAR transformylase)